MAAGRIWNLQTPLITFPTIQYIQSEVIRENNEPSFPVAHSKTTLYTKDIIGQILQIIENES